MFCGHRLFFDIYMPLLISHCTKLLFIQKASTCDRDINLLICIPELDRGSISSGDITAISADLCTGDWCFSL